MTNEEKPVRLTSSSRKKLDWNLTPHSVLGGYREEQFAFRTEIWEIRINNAVRWDLIVWPFDKKSLSERRFDNGSYPPLVWVQNKLFLIQVLILLRFSQGKLVERTVKERQTGSKNHPWCDLKSKNVLMKSLFGVEVADLGLSRVWEQVNDSKSSGGDYGVIESYYLYPENIFPGSRKNQKPDCWALIWAKLLLRTHLFHWIRYFLRIRFLLIPMKIWLKSWMNSLAFYTRAILPNLESRHWTQSRCRFYSLLQNVKNPDPRWTLYPIWCGGQPLRTPR